MSNVRKSSLFFVLALALVAWGCSNGGGSPTAPDPIVALSQDAKCENPPCSGGGGGNSGKDAAYSVVAYDSGNYQWYSSEEFEKAGGSAVQDETPHGIVPEQPTWTDPQGLVEKLNGFLEAMTWTPANCNIEAKWIDGVLIKASKGVGTVTYHFVTSPGNIHYSLDIEGELFNVAAPGVLEPGGPIPPTGKTVLTNFSSAVAAKSTGKATCVGTAAGSAAPPTRFNICVGPLSTCLD